MYMYMYMYIEEEPGRENYVYLGEGGAEHASLPLLSLNLKMGVCPLWNKILKWTVIIAYSMLLGLLSTMY